MLLHIPFSSSSEASGPLMRCIRYAANQCEFSEHQVAIIMSHFLEELTLQVEVGKVVRIPGFGNFGVKVWQPRNNPDATERYCYPAFSAARPFRNVVRLYAYASSASAEAIDRHRRHSHHTSKKGRDHQNPITASRAFRDRIRAQAARMGCDVRGAK